MAQTVTIRSIRFIAAALVWDSNYRTKYDRNPRGFQIARNVLLCASLEHESLARFNAEIRNGAFRANFRLPSGPPVPERQHAAGVTLRVSTTKALIRRLMEENPMNAKTFVLGSCAVLALGIATAQAGPCSDQIDNIRKILASKDAGSGPTPGAGSASTTTGAAGQHL